MRGDGSFSRVVYIRSVACEERIAEAICWEYFTSSNCEFLVFLRFYLSEASKRQSETKNEHEKTFHLRLSRVSLPINVSCLGPPLSSDREEQTLSVADCSLSCMFCEWNLLSSHRCRMSSEGKRRHKGKLNVRNSRRLCRQLQGGRNSLHFTVSLPAAATIEKKKRIARKYVTR